MLLTDKYADKIHGIITCYDRMIIQGYIPNWSHAETMTAYMKLNGIRIFDYPTSFSPVSYTHLDVYKRQPFTLWKIPYR